MRLSRLRAVHVRDTCCDVHVLLQFARLPGQAPLSDGVRHMPRLASAALPARPTSRTVAPPKSAAVAAVFTAAAASAAIAAITVLRHSRPTSAGLVELAGRGRHVDQQVVVR